MAVPEGTFQRAVFVSIPVALILVIFVTSSFFPPEGQPGPQDVPYLLVQVMGEDWNESVNETALVYVWSPLRVTFYEYIAINVSGVEASVNLTSACGASAAFAGGNWTCVGGGIPSSWLRFPVADDLAVNVSAVAIWGEKTFEYNATVLFGWGRDNWMLREWPDQDLDAPFLDHVNVLQASLRERT